MVDGDQPNEEASGMELASARLRSLYEGSVFTEDLILCTSEQWAEALRMAPSFAAWRVASFPNGFIVAVEPLADIIARLGDLPLACDAAIPNRRRKLA